MSSAAPEAAPSGAAALTWVVITQGRRPVEFADAVVSLQATDPEAEIIVVQNGGTPIDAPSGTTLVSLPDNVGIPAARHLGVQRSSTPFVGFLDDDAAMLTPQAADATVARFHDDEALGAVSFRIIDEDDASNRRHVPRPGGRSAERSGEVVSFLGGASAIRRSAYERAGGYWGDLFYAHEEIDLAWRLHDMDCSVFYDADIVVRHPRTDVSRHADGWYLTGRNRVLIARRNLPWPVAAAHVVTWLVVGSLRVPDRACRRAYVRGWWRGWRTRVDRRPIRWRTVVRISRLGRPPVI